MAEKKKPVKKKTVKKKPETQTAFDKLSISEKHFVKAYIDNFGVAYKAYQAVFPKSKYDSARTEASKFFAKPNVKLAIAEEYKKYWKDKDEEIEKSKTYQMIHSIGNSNIADIINLSSGTLTVKDLSEIPPEAQQAIQSVQYTCKDTTNGTDENIKVTMHDKLKALELRAKMQRMLDNKLDVGDITITVSPAVRPKEDE